MKHTLVGAAWMLLALPLALLLGGPAATPTARAGTHLSVDWTMPDRYGDADHDGFGDQVYPPDAQAQVDPGGYRVDLTVGGADCGAQTIRDWWIEGQKITTADPRLLSPGGASGCSLSYRFPTEGVYEVAFAEHDQNGKLLGQVKRAITVQDFLIVSIGDSVASGEGNPEVPSAVSPSWENASDAAAQCHRSRWAGPARAALALEQSDPHSSVTFIHLACSGATILNGLLGPELAGQGPVRIEQPAQLDQLKQLVGNREVDALFLSIGANDVHFSNIVLDCLMKTDCNDPKKPGSPAQHYARDAAKLPGLYDQLANALDTLGIDSQRVYLSEYFDPTHDDGGTICDGTILLDWFRNPSQHGSITGSEAQWASTDLVGGMNQIGAAAAKAYGWNPVGGITSQFLNHGYCANDRWVVRVSESFATQAGSKDGTLHPNHSGQGVYGNRLGASATSDLLPGAAALPRRPFQRLVLQGENPAGFADTVDESVAPGTTVELRVRLNGRDTGFRNLDYGLQGRGSLSALSGTTDGSGQASFSYTAPASPTGCDDGPVCGVVTASFTDADGVHSDALSVGVEAAPVTVSIVPTSAILSPGQKQSFVATVTGTTDARVAWSATGGTIYQSGAYTAGSSPGTYTVTATSQADPSVHDSAIVRITAPVDTGIAPLLGQSSGFAFAGTSLTCPSVTRSSVLGIPYTESLTCSGVGVDGSAASTNGDANGSFTVTDYSGADETAYPVRDLGAVHASGAGTGSGSNATGFATSDYSIRFTVKSPASMTIRTTLASGNAGGFAFVEFLCGTFSAEQGDIYNLTSSSSNGNLARNDLGDTTLPLPPGANCRLHARVDVHGFTNIGTGTGSFDVTAGFAP